jgi:hypothetical protein
VCPTCDVHTKTPETRNNEQDDKTIGILRGTDFLLIEKVGEGCKTLSSGTPKYLAIER